MAREHWRASYVEHAWREVRSSLQRAPTTSRRMRATRMPSSCRRCRACATHATRSRLHEKRAATRSRFVSMVCRSIRRIRCMGGKMGPVQKALLKLLQEAVPVGYVHILQIFELRQECSRCRMLLLHRFQNDNTVLICLRSRSARLVIAYAAQQSPWGPTTALGVFLCQSE